MAGQPGDPEDELPLPLPNEDEAEDLQDQELVEDEADEESEPDSPDKAEADQREPPQVAREPSRGERRHQALANEVRQRDQQIADLNRRLDGILAASQPRQPQGETPEARAQRLALLTPEERIREELNEAKSGFARDMQLLRISSADASDKAAFQAKATVDPYYKKFADRVEAELTTLRNKGMNAAREDVMFYLIGKDAVEGRHTPAVQKQRTEAAQRLRRQQAKPSNAGSDVAASRRTRGDSLERRLENVEL